MTGSDSDASSTASHGGLAPRNASSIKANSVRYERCYSRSLLLQLSKSDKIRPPQGLKPLTEWYGEYELPSLHPVNTASNAGPNGRYSGRDGHAGGRRDRERERGERGAAASTAGTQADRFNPERDSHARSAAGAPATGQMGDFKLAGQRPFTLPKDNDGGDALTGGSRRRQNQRDLELKDRDLENKERNWAQAGANSAERRRQLGGEFVKKDGRAAEEGGWRSSRETMQLGRDRQPRDRLERPSFNDRDRDGRGGQLNSGDRDRRRQPAWMDEDDSFGRREGPSGSFQRRGQNGLQSGDATPAWMADEPSSSSKGKFDDSLEALESRPSDMQHSSDAAPVDSIQAFKAQMKEMERRKKVQEQKELRREMGLPDLPDEEYAKPEDSAPKASKSDQSAKESQPAASKSVFADFLLPMPKEKEASKPAIVEEKPRSSRFARMFAADAAAAQTGDRVSPANNSHSPSQASSTAPQMTQSSSSNSLLAALLPGAAKSPMPAPPRMDGASPKPPPTQTDNQSMARLMEMLHMSSATPVGNQAASAGDSKSSNTPVSPPLQQGGPSAKQQSRARGQPNSEAPHPARAHTDARSPDYRPDEYHSPQPLPPRSQGLPPSSHIGQPAQSREQVSSPQSRLANRSSAYGLNDPAIQQQSRRQEPLHAPVPPQQPNVNLLQLLAGQTSPPPGPLTPHAHGLSPAQPQQVPRRAQPVQSPPPHGLGPRPPLGSGPNDHQHLAQMASLMQGQPGSANQPVPPPGMQFGRPSSQAPFLPPQGAFPPPQGAFSPSHQRQQHPGHLRSPSGHMNPAMLMQQQQQQRTPSNGHPQQQQYNGMRGESAASHPLPPPQAFAQQNALAQLLAQGGHPGQPYGGMRAPPPNGPQGYQPQSSMPPLPPMHMQQQHSQPLHMHQNQPPPQQNQIDLMALLTGGGNGGGFAGR